MKKKMLAILFGGLSSEYSVSLQSAHAVIAHLDTEKYEPVLVGITKQGHWFRYRGSEEAILHDKWCKPKYCTHAVISPSRGDAGLVEFGEEGAVFTKPDAAFPVMHGPFGEDGTIQGLLELAGIPVVGCGTTASAICMDKDAAHRIVRSSGIKVPESKVFSNSAPFEEIETAATSLRYPVFVKPARAGSSFGVSRVVSAEGLATAVAEAFGHDRRIILEEAIAGFEVGCAVLGCDELTIGALDEVELAGGFFDFTEKYNLVTSRIHVPARLPEEKASEIKRAGADIYKLLGCSGFARVDMFATPDGRIVFNEVNTIPGFTVHSRYPAMMKAIGLDFATMLDRLIETAVAS